MSSTKIIAGSGEDCQGGLDPRINSPLRDRPPVSALSIDAEHETALFPGSTMLTRRQYSPEPRARTYSRARALLGIGFPIQEAMDREISCVSRQVLEIDWIQEKIGRGNKKSGRLKSLACAQFFEREYSISQISPAVKTLPSSCSRKNMGKQQAPVRIMPSLPHFIYGLRQPLRLSGGGSGPDLEHLGAADRADTLGRRLTVLHRHQSRVCHLSFGLTFHAIGFHNSPLFFLNERMFVTNLSLSFRKRK